MNSSEHQLEAIIGRYSFLDKIKCGLSNCHTPHGRGYIVTTKAGLQTNIGKDCGKTYFGVDFETLPKKFDRDMTAAESRSYAPQHPDMVKTRRQIESLERAAGLSPVDGSEEAKLVVKLKSDLAAASERYGRDHPDVVRLTSTITALDGKVALQGSREDARQLVRLKAELVAASARYGVDHPDVAQLRQIIETLEARVAEKAASGGGGGGRKPENPAYIALQTQVDTVRIEAKSLERRRDELRQHLAQLEQRIEDSPGVEREYLDLTRDRESSLLRYREIKAKLMEAEIAQDLEKDRKSERFSLIDPPQYPEKPRSPNRAAIFMIGLILSAAGGLGGVGILETLDTSVRNNRDLERTLGIDVLSSIPRIENDDDRRRKKLPVKWILLGGLGLFFLLLALVHFAWMPLDVFWLTLLNRIGLS